MHIQIQSTTYTYTYIIYLTRPSMQEKHRLNCVLFRILFSRMELGWLGRVASALLICRWPWTLYPLVHQLMHKAAYWFYGNLQFSGKKATKPKTTAALQPKDGCWLRIHRASFRDNIFLLLGRHNLPVTCWLAKSLSGQFSCVSSQPHPCSSKCQAIRLVPFWTLCTIMTNYMGDVCVQIHPQSPWQRDNNLGMHMDPQLITQQTHTVLPRSLI